MTESEWNDCADAGAMIDYLWSQRGITSHALEMRIGGELEVSIASESPHAGLETALHRFYLASCRRIFALLPETGSRGGVEMGEKFLAGETSADDVKRFTWHTEAAAFEFDYNLHPNHTAPLIAAVREMPKPELRLLLNPPEAADEVEPRDLLKRAAYFADYAMIYSSLTPKGPPPNSYRIFLSADLLRQHVSRPSHE